MHNWCTNKNLTGETCFFLLLLLVFWQYICCFCCFQIRFKFTFSPLFKSLDCFSSLPVFPLEPESRRNWGAKKSRKIRSHDFRNKCFPVERLSFFFRRGGGGGFAAWHGLRGWRWSLLEERQVNMSPNKAWVHFPAALPPGHQPLHIQVKSAFCLPKPCDLWPGSIDQTS